MTPRLSSITVTDFRSIRGSVTIPLDAPVVLIYGQNGAGKTSALSAVELALTGRVPSLARVDDNYLQHLVHKQGAEACLSVTAVLHGEEADSTGLVIRDGQLIGSPLLGTDEARFFNERCYLPQATLGRLLEIYQHREHKKSDSPLTEFVKDLLGLDHLDALVDGLHDAGDVRRLRTRLPDYWAVREQIPALEKALAQVSEASDQLEARIAAGSTVLTERLISLGLGSELAQGPADSLTAALRAVPEEERLQQLARLRRDLGAAREQWKTTEGTPGQVQRSEVETAASRAQKALDAWRQGPGHVLESVVGALALYFPNLPSAAASGPEAARSAAAQAATAELQRCTLVLERDEADTKKLVELERSLERARSRTAVLEQQMTQHAADAGRLAQALATVLPHVSSDICPVCQRDYRETSQTPLHAHVAGRISALTESAGRLEALARERAETARAYSVTERERELLATRQLAPGLRDELKTRRARLAELGNALISLTSAATEGANLLTTSSLASRRLADLRARDQAATALREWVASLAQQFGQAPLGAAEPIGAALDRLQSIVAAREKAITEQQSLRRTALNDWEELKSLRNLRERGRADMIRMLGELERLRSQKERADATIGQAKHLARVAREARNSVVRRVFNHSLNSVWRDLFVRLAPEEPFVPAFALPVTQGAVEATLETMYRSGGKGGDPRAMLSAGNLNTAALTLFLALHLSVEQKLPWLLVDDPFQSMDEVHIAQFAALLRTLSKQHDRQVVIAVHERPLFDYLVLELSPAFPGDRLITVELGRAASGATTMTYEPLVWKMDPAVHGGSNAVAS